MSDEAEPRALTAEGLFRLVTDEVFADGVLEDHEQQLMKTLAKFLRLDPERAREIARDSKAAYKAGQLEPSGRLSPRRLYDRILVAIMADGEVDDYEAQLLVGMKQVLGIGDEAHAGMLAAAARRTASAGRGAAPPPQEVASPDPASKEVGSTASAAEGAAPASPAPAPAPTVAPGSVPPRAPAEPPAPADLEDLPSRVAFALQVRNPDLMAKMRRKMRDLQPATKATAPTLARCLASWAILSMPPDDVGNVEEALADLRDLRPFAANPQVQEESLIAWGCFLEWNLERTSRGAAPSGGKGRAQVEAAFDQVLDLLDARKPTKEAVKVLCSSLGNAGIVQLVTAADQARLEAIAAALAKVSGAHADDDAVQFEIAKVMVNAAILVVDTWPSTEGGGLFASLKSLVGAGERTAKDECLDTFAATMEAVLHRAPHSPEVRDAQGRFQRHTGRRLKAPRRGPPVPRTPQVPGRTPVPEGWTDQAAGWPQGRTRSRYPNPAAAVDDLEDAFAAQDWRRYGEALRALYILDTEMGLRQATFGRMARAVGKHLAAQPNLIHAGPIGQSLRHFVEDLGDSRNTALEREARALQDMLRGR